MSFQKKILFRADGNNTTGLGHLYRLFALVEIYKPYFEVIFLTKESSTKESIPAQYTVEFIPDAITILQEPQWISEHYVSSEHLIVADGYQFNETYQKQIKQLGFKLVYIDDLIESHIYADIVVNHAANVDSKLYKKEPYTTIALGTEYAILRPAFIKAAQKQKENISQISNVFVCFGGADALDLSLKATKALLQLDQIKLIHVVLGAAYKQTEIFELASENNRVKLYQNLDELALVELMESCQLGIAPSSTIVYELCSVKMPIISGYFVENQKGIYQALVNENAIFGAGNLVDYTVEDFKRVIEPLLNNENFKPYLEAQQQLFDGLSASRFVKLLNDLLISFRKATADDMLLVYEWSNDLLVRQNSYDSEPIQLEDHKVWFLNKIVNDRTLFLIALYDGIPAGVIRFEMDIDHSVVGILVANTFRGKKLSSSLLSESAKYYFKQNHLPIFAYIKEENKASVKAFESAGYSFHKKEKVKEFPSFVYKLEKEDVT